jgi:hypothetical protein
VGRGKKWWEPGSDESYILFLYRRYDAINHLLPAIANDILMMQSIKVELSEIFWAISAILPESTLDFVAQSVILFTAGKINIGPDELRSFMGALDRYIETDGNLIGGVETHVASKSLRTWRRYQGKVSRRRQMQIDAPNAVPPGAF